MKRNDIKALHSKSVAELTKQVTELQLELSKKRHEKRVGRVSNTRSISQLADDIARIKTIIREKELTGIAE